MSAARAAILYIQDLAQRNEEFGYHIGPFTRGFDLLCAAEAELTGKPIDEVKDERSKTLDQREAS